MVEVETVLEMYDLKNKVAVMNAHNIGQKGAPWSENFRLDLNRGRIKTSAPVTTKDCLKSPTAFGRGDRSLANQPGIPVNTAAMSARL